MFKIFKNLSSVVLFFYELKKSVLLIFLYFALSACGELVDVDRASESDVNTNVGATIYWAPMTVNGQSAETYREK